MAGLRGERDMPGSFTPVSAARAAAELSILVLFDASQRSEYYALPGETMMETFERIQREGGNKWYLDEGEAYRAVSGGANYEIPIGEFPIYDELNEIFDAPGDRAILDDDIMKRLGRLTARALEHAPE
ncbi:MAG: hypothetical protein AAGB93_13500 [Planctomycetota bacterium]